MCKRNFYHLLINIESNTQYAEFTRSSFPSVAISLSAVAITAFDRQDQNLQGQMCTLGNRVNTSPR